MTAPLPVTHRRDQFMSGEPGGSGYASWFVETLTPTLHYYPEVANKVVFETVLNQALFYKDSCAESLNYSDISECRRVLIHKNGVGLLMPCRVA